MKTVQFALIIIIGMLLHFVVTTPIRNNYDQDDLLIPDDKHQDPQLWQNSGKVEGDMILTPEQHKHLYQDNKNRNGVIDPTLYWPNRTIPYEISNDFPAFIKIIIELTLKNEYSKTCISVVPRTNEIDYVYITGKWNDGCWSYVGRLGGKQELNLNPLSCINLHTIIHEFLHAAGFYHQQSVPDRDEYVTIQWDNIKTGQEHNFDKYGNNVVSSFGESYDYGSVVHYSEYAFSKNGERTIIPKKNVQIVNGPKLSPIDIVKLNKMYGC